MTRRGRRAAWLGVFALAFALRVLGLGWGLPGPGGVPPPFHPDEHVVYEQAAALRDAPGPATFVWGGALYPRLGARVRDSLARIAPPERAFAATLLALRALNVGVALATLAGVAWIAARLLGRGPALLAAALYACFPVGVLDSHWARPEVCTTALATGALACACGVARGGGARLLVAGALLAGLASAALLPGAVALAPLLAGWLEAGPRRGEPGSARGRHAARGLAYGLAGGLAGYALGSWESALFPQAFRAGLARALETHGDGGFVVPLALWGRVPLYAFGTPAALLGAAGLGVLALGRAPGARSVAVQAVAVLLLLTRVGGDMMRHLHLLAPALAVSAAAALATVAHRRSRRVAGALVVLATLQLSLAYVLPMAFGEDARVRAGRWLAERAPPGATIGVVTFFFGDRSHQPRLPAGSDLRTVALPLRPDVDTAARLARLAPQPAFVVVGELAWGRANSPLERAFLRALEDGSGGRFERVAEFGPRLRPLCIPDALGAVRPADLLYVRGGLVVFARRH